MSNKKKILYFVPDNPYQGRAGNITRFTQMLDYFNHNSQEFTVDYVTERLWGNWDDASIEKFRIAYPAINLKIIDRKVPRSTFLQYLFKYKIPEVLFNYFRHKIDFTTWYLKKNFRSMTKDETYDFAIISYVHWGNLIKELKNYKKAIIDTHDFITGQYATCHKGNHLKISNIFKNELKILNQFDEIWTYSVEEKYIFEQFTSRSVQQLPISFKQDVLERQENSISSKLIYIASNNPHNVRGADWFLKNALPYIDPNIRIVVIGKICAHFPDTEQIVKLGMVDDLDAQYRDAKVAICPMISGTGIKIKVVEALSYGLPVVTNPRGIDGLFNKKQNGCIVTESGKEFASAVNRLFLDEPYYHTIRQEGLAYFAANHTIEQEEEFLNRTFLSGNP